MRVRPLQWWPEIALQECATGLGETLRHWSLDWGVAVSQTKATALNASDVNADDGSGATWRALLKVGNADQQVWIGSTTSLEEEVAAAVFHEPLRLDGSDRKSSVANQVVAAATEDLVQTLCSHLLCEAGTMPHGDVSKPPTEQYLAWSGAVCLMFSLGTSRFALHIGPACMENLLAGRVPKPHAFSKEVAAQVHPLQNALASQRITIEAQLDAVELDLGTLEGLQLGDVIRLTHPLSKPLLLVTEHGLPWAAGYLGQVAGHKAVELAQAQQEKGTTT